MIRGSRAVITRLASYLPSRVLSNDDLQGLEGAWPVARIEQKTGIRERRLAAEDEFTSDLAVAAAERLFADGDVRREDLEFLVLVTVSPDRCVPATANRVHRGLGLPATAGAFDVSLACSGYPNGLGIAASLVESGRARKVLLVTADRFTAFTEHADFGARALFGDAATATLIEAEDSAVDAFARIGATRYGTDGGGELALHVAGSGLRAKYGGAPDPEAFPTLQMDGPAVFDFVIRTLPGFLGEFLADEGLAVDDVTQFVFHQANGFILDHVRRRMKIPRERFALTLGRVGNTNSSSIPLGLLDVRAAGGLDGGGPVVVAGFGAGLSWSVARLDLL